MIQPLYTHFKGHITAWFAQTGGTMETTRRETGRAGRWTRVGVGVGRLRDIGRKCQLESSTAKDNVKIRPGFYRHTYSLHTTKQ
ncbi:uncharacterized [Tachysurus ichikawai]